MDPQFTSIANRYSKKVVGPVVQREAVAHLQAKIGLSERRACQIVGADRTMIRYQSQRAPDTALRTRLRDLAYERRRFGYRRLFILLRREGEPSGINRIYRVYREEGLTVRKRRARRKAIGTRALRILVEARANARWSLDPRHGPRTSGGTMARCMTSSAVGGGSLAIALGPMADKARPERRR